MPLAWLEAMAMQNLLVAGAPGPGPELIRHGENGLLCDPHRPADIAEKISFALQRPEAAEAMARQARADILQHFSATILARRNLDFYRSLKPLQN